MKKLLITAMAAILTIGTAAAATTVNNDAQEAKGILKKHLDAAKQEIIQTQEKKYGVDTKKTKTYENPAEKKIKDLEAKRDSELELIDNSIKAKNDEIKSIKKSKLSEAEQTRRIKLAQKQIEYLNKKKETTKNIYQKQIDFLKGKK